MLTYNSVYLCERLIGVQSKRSNKPQALIFVQASDYQLAFTRLRGITYTEFISAKLNSIYRLLLPWSILPYQATCFVGVNEPLFALIYIEEVL